MLHLLLFWEANIEGEGRVAVGRAAFTAVLGVGVVVVRKEVVGFVGVDTFVVPEIEVCFGRAVP